MKQLLHTFGSHDKADSYFVVALHDRAFVGSFSSSGLVEFQQPAEPEDDTGDAGTDTAKGGDGAEQQEEQQERQLAKEGGHVPPLHQIQAVAGCVVGVAQHDARSSDIIYCAVARQSKQLAIYRVAVADLEGGGKESSSSSTDVVQSAAVTLHQTPKRVSSMMFAQIASRHGSGDHEKSKPPLTVLITGDLAGDAFAYSLTQASSEITAKEAANESRLPHRRLLLGHTASMLTSVAMISATTSSGESSSSDNEIAKRQFILTADRDEKIRVTAFPSTFEIHGFLFGHTAFVSCMTVLDTSVGKYGNLCFSCGGDNTLRVWDCLACTQVAMLDLQTGLTRFQVASGVPCDVCVGYDDDDKESGTGVVVATIYDRSSNLDFFSLADDGDQSKPLVERHQVTLPGQPLGLARVGAQHIVVLLQEPHYMECYDWKGNKCDDMGPALQSLKEQASNCKIALPNAILERDEYDELKMSKSVERRGPAMIMPWNNADRKEVHSKKRIRRNKRRRNKRAKRKESAAKDDDGDDDGEQDKGSDSDSKDGEEANEELEKKSQD